MTSSELAELRSICTRIAIVYGGRKKLEKISIGQVWKPTVKAA